MILNRFKIAKLLRESAEVQARRGLLDHVTEGALVRVGMIQTSDEILRLEHDNYPLACTERVLLCLFGAHLALEGHY